MATGDDNDADGDDEDDDDGLQGFAVFGVCVVELFTPTHFEQWVAELRLCFCVFVMVMMMMIM